MRMKAENYSFSAIHIFMKILYLCSKNMRQGELHSSRKIDNYLVILIRLPYIYNRIYHLKGIFYLSSGKTFRRIFKREVPVCFFGKLFKQLGSVYSNLFNFLFVLCKYLLSLCYRCRIVYMDDRMRSTLYRLKSPLNNMLPRLGKYLNRYIRRDEISLNECTHKIILCLRSSWKSYFYLLKSYGYKHFKKLQLFLQTHRFYKSLITIPKVNRTPYRRLVYIFFFNPVISRLLRHKIISLILIVIIHIFSIAPLKLYKIVDIF